MSFILDALKKSESERHRQSGPVLMDVRIAAPRRRVPAWAWAIAIVLAVNLGVLAWLLWVSPSHRAGEAAAVAATAPATAAPAAAAPATSAPALAPPASTTPAAATPAASVPADPALVAGAPANPAPAAAAPGVAQQPSAAATSLPPPVPLAQNIDVTTLPRVSDMVAAGVVLPELRLSLHVYDPQPQNRYVLLNGARLREGDFTPEGVRVIAIAPAGVVVEWRNRRMLLGAGG